METLRIKWCVPHSSVIAIGHERCDYARLSAMWDLQIPISRCSMMFGEVTLLKDRGATGRKVVLDR